MATNIYLTHTYIYKEGFAEAPQERINVYRRPRNEYRDGAQRQSFQTGKNNLQFQRRGEEDRGYSHHQGGRFARADRDQVGLNDDDGRADNIPRSNEVVDFERTGNLSEGVYRGASGRKSPPHARYREEAEYGSNHVIQRGGSSDYFPEGSKTGSGYGSNHRIQHGGSSDYFSEGPKTGPSYGSKSFAVLPNQRPIQAVSPLGGRSPSVGHGVSERTESRVVEFALSSGQANNHERSYPTPNPQLQRHHPGSHPTKSLTTNRGNGNGSSNRPPAVHQDLTRRVQRLPEESNAVHISANQIKPLLELPGFREAVSELSLLDPGWQSLVRSGLVLASKLIPVR